MKKSLLLITMIVLFFGCEKEQEKANKASVTEHDSMGRHIENSFEEERESRNEFVTRLSSSLFYYLVMGKPYFSYSSIDLNDNDICQNIKEIYRKIEVKKGKMVITDAINYLSYPKGSITNEQCTAEKYEKANIVKKGKFSGEELAVEIDSHLKKSEDFFSELGLDRPKYNVRRPRDNEMVAIFELLFDTKELFVVNDPMRKIELHFYYMDQYNTPTKRTVTFYIEGSNSIAESGFNEYFNGENLQINESNEYLQIFNIEAE